MFLRANEVYYWPEKSCLQMYKQSKLEGNAGTYAYCQQPRLAAPVYLSLSPAEGGLEMIWLRLHAVPDLKFSIAFRPATQLRR